MRPQTRARFRHTLPRVRSLAGPRTGSAWCLFQPRALAFPTGLVRGLKAYGMTLMVAALATPAAAGESPKPGGILTYVIPADAPPSFDARREGTFATVHSAAPFYSVLIRIDPDNPSSTTDFVCDLCTEMPQPTNGGKTYTFKIRNDKQAVRVAALRSDRNGNFDTVMNGNCNRCGQPAARCATVPAALGLRRELRPVRRPTGGRFIRQDAA